MDATEMELAGQIKKHRQALGISQEALAEKIYVSRQTISNWETARTYPDVQSLLFLATFATALGLSFAVKKTKDRNNILTYQEILAFCAGKEPNRTSRYNAFVRKHKSAHDMLLVTLSAIFGAAFVVVLRFIF